MLTSQEITSALDSADLGRSLLVLRSFRESFLNQLKDDLYHSNADRLLEDIANQTESSTSSYAKLVNKLTTDERFQSAIDLRTFDRLCRRIARLEREALHLYVPAHLEAA